VMFNMFIPSDDEEDYPASVKAKKPTYFSFQSWGGFFFTFIKILCIRHDNKPPSFAAKFSYLEKYAYNTLKQYIADEKGKVMFRCLEYFQVPTQINLVIKEYKRRGYKENWGTYTAAEFDKYVNEGHFLIHKGENVNDTIKWVLYLKEWDYTPRVKKNKKLQLEDAADERKKLKCSTEEIVIPSSPPMHSPPSNRCHPPLFNEKIHMDIVMDNIKNGVRFAWKEEENFTSSQDEEEKLLQLEGLLRAYPPRIDSIYDPQQRAYIKKWNELNARKKALWEHKETRLANKIKADKDKEKKKKRKAKKKEKKKEEKQEIFVFSE